LNFRKEKMRLAIDIHHLLLENAGTKRVTVNLLNELYKNAGIQVFEFKPSYHLSYGNSLAGKLAGHLCRFFWVHIQLPIVCYRQNIDVLLSPEFHNPLFTTCKRIVIVHDMHMRAQREFNSSLWFYLYYIPFIEKAIKRADRIITISDFAKLQIEQYMKVDEKKIAVVYWGVDPLFLSDTSKISFDAVSLQYKISKGKYLLFVGTFEARKNVERIVEAFALLQKRACIDNADLKLVIVGKPSLSKFSDRSSEIEALVKKNGLTEKVVFCGFVTDDCLLSLYANALCLLFPSLYEGFGFPIIEGFATGTPVITSNICSMPEIAGGAALLVDPFRVDDIEQKMYDVVRSTDLRKDLIQKGEKRVEIFKWEICSKQIAEYLFLLTIDGDKK
jgi:glycosyltransferase involved in cell wall biosynthesis